MLQQTETKDCLQQKLRLKNCDFSLKTDNPNENRDFLTNTFFKIVNNAPLKKKLIKGNQGPFMTTSLWKESIPELVLEIDFVKALRKKMKNYTKN